MHEADGSASAWTNGLADLHGWLLRPN